MNLSMPFTIKDYAAGKVTSLQLQYNKGFYLSVARTLADFRDPVLGLNSEHFGTVKSLESVTASVRQNQG